MDEVPSLSVVTDAAFSPQDYLGSADMMLPFFAKVNTAYDTVYRIVADVGVDTLYQRLKLKG